MLRVDKIVIRIKYGNDADQIRRAPGMEKINSGIEAPGRVENSATKSLVEIILS